MAPHLTPDLIQECRNQFPALSREHNGQPAVFLDGPAGTQVTQSVIDAISHYYCTCNANHGGQFATSRESDAFTEQAHRALADFVGADDWKEIVFGANMTSLTFAFSRAIAQTWSEGDNIVVTRLDHDANVSTWALAARDHGVEVRYAEIHKGDCTLDVTDLKSKIDQRTRLVAVGLASNSSGSINPVQEITSYAKQFNAQVFIDAVHYAPHRLIDVHEIGCDFLACSTYKFYGPHIGVLWAKSEILEDLEAYKVRPSATVIPEKWMTGTQNFASLCGSRAAVDYLADLGRTLANDGSLQRRQALQIAYEAITIYEDQLCLRLLDGLAAIEDLKVHGITDINQLEDRVPTISITHPKLSASQIAFELGERGIFVWDGNYYALELTEQLNLEPEGMVRLGLVHYNTLEEVDRLLDALQEILT
ncbi:MAG: cysteine desulfurase-like protein [Planctomycetaceae bacterium]|nr:cysteine desulfurase-like protein [Planctomycetaceae bacterium]